MRTSIEGASGGGAIRKDGRIIRVPLAHDVREIPFPGGSRTAMTIPWGDVSTAFRSTGIPNIRVYTSTSRRAIDRARRAARFAPLLRIPGVTALMQLAVKQGGPSAEQRAKGTVDVWGEVRRGSETGSMSMTTPEGYELTVRAALASVDRVLAAPPAGALTPSQAFGAEFVLGIPGVTLHQTP